MTTTSISPTPPPLVDLPAKCSKLSMPPSHCSCIAYTYSSIHILDLMCVRRTVWENTKRIRLGEEGFASALDLSASSARRHAGWSLHLQARGTCGAARVDPVTAFDRVCDRTSPVVISSPCFNNSVHVFIESIHDGSVMASKGAAH